MTNRHNISNIFLDLGNTNITMEKVLLKHKFIQSKRPINIQKTVFKRELYIYYLFLLCLVFTSCGIGNNNPTEKVNKSLVEKGIKNYSLVLKDMGSESNTDFWHEYEVLQYPNEESGEMTVIDLVQTRVSAEYFEKNINNLGMEIGFSVNGEFTNEISDVGFNHLIGNPKYGKFLPAEDNQEGWTGDEKLGGDESTIQGQDTVRRRRRSAFGGSMLMWYFMGRYAGMNNFFRTRQHPISQNNFNQHQSYKQGASKTPYRRFATGTSPVSSGYGKSWNALPEQNKSQIKSRAKSTAKASRSAKSNSLRKRSGGFGK